MSTTIKAVFHSKCYGDTVPTKLIWNVLIMRMGTALKKLAKEERLGGRVKGRLTEQKCKPLQNYYRCAVLDDLGSIKTMSNAI